ncbi:MAG: glycosylasparaginase, partial [Ignavibacteriales bacterium]|nr:glycosylasparaginase [Ignavibacteriales bacterium]
CEFAINRLYKSLKDFADINISYLAISKSGEVGAFSLKGGFTYCLTTPTENKAVTSDCLMK